MGYKHQLKWDLNKDQKLFEYLRGNERRWGRLHKVALLHWVTQNYFGDWTIYIGFKLWSLVLVWLNSLQAIRDVPRRCHSNVWSSSYSDLQRTLFTQLNDW